MWHRISSLGGRIFDLWILHSAPRLGAALAYYTLLSLAPLSVILVKMIALPFGNAFAEKNTFIQLQFVAGPQGLSVLQNLIAAAHNTPATIWASMAAIFLLLFGASSVFAELRSALNLIWDVQEPPAGFLRDFLLERLIAFGMIICLGLFMMLFTGTSIVLAVWAEYISNRLALPPWMLRFANGFLSFVVISGGFTLMFRFVPAVRIAWKDAGIGALVTAALFVLARLPLELYLSSSGIGSAYGAAASLVAFISWVYLAAQIFYLGGEFTRVYSEEFGSLICQREREL